VAIFSCVIGYVTLDFYHSCSERSEEALKPVLLPPNRLRKPAIALGISHPCGVRNDSLERYDT
jgi:hypothetical protein